MLKNVTFKGKPTLQYNSHYNRYESKIDHIYASFNYYDFKYAKAKPYKAKIKCRLVHELGNSVVLPDYIFMANGFIQPLQFTSPVVMKLDDRTISCEFFIDIQNGETIKVRFFNHGLQHTYSDKSQLFDCEIYGPTNIENYSCGEFKVIDNNIHLKLFHHTNESGYKGITESKSLRSSRWNYRGSKECINYHFAYFTHIPEIKFSSDLITVAMSADGNMDYMIDSFVQPKVLGPNYRETYKDSIYTAKVYRSTTADRNNSITFFVPVESVDVKHIYVHNRSGWRYHEICFPYIHRIKVAPNSILTFDANNIIANRPPVVHSEYSIIGNAESKLGLAAPFEEEETKFIFKIEDCGNQSMPNFWFSHANTDLYSPKMVNTMEMKEVDDNPTK